MFYKCELPDPTVGHTATPYAWLLKLSQLARVSFGSVIDVLDLPSK